MTGYARIEIRQPTGHLLLLLRAICKGKAVYAFSGFVISGAGWMSVEFEDGLPILSEKVVKALEAA